MGANWIWKICKKNPRIFKNYRKFVSNIEYKEIRNMKLYFLLLTFAFNACAQTQQIRVKKEIPNNFSSVEYNAPQNLNYLTYSLDKEEIESIIHSIDSVRSLPLIPQG